MVMKYRMNALVDAESATTATTKKIDLDSQAVASRITVEFKGTNNLSVPTAHGAKMVSKIEIRDGSDILYSLSGIESQARSYFDQGKLPMQVNEYRNDVMNIQTFDIDFGRYLWDPAFGLDLRSFQNPQLHITHNKASGGSAPDAGTLSVFEYLFGDGSPSPGQFISSREHKTYSLTSSATEQTDLPVDLPIRNIQVQSLSGGKQPWEQYNKIKLTQNNDERVYINTLKTSDLIKLLKAYPRIEEDFLGIGTGSAVDHFTTVTYDCYGNITNLDAALTNNYLAQDYGGTQAVVGDANDAFHVHMSGLSPHAALNIPMGLPNEPGTWHVPAPNEKLRLDITAGSSVGSSSTCEIVVQQVRRNGTR